MWFCKKKKVLTSVGELQSLNEINKHYGSQIEELNKYLAMLCPINMGYYRVNPLLADAIKEKIARIEEEKLDI